MGLCFYVSAGLLVCASIDLMANGSMIMWVFGSKVCFSVGLLLSGSVFLRVYGFVLLWVCVYGSVAL